MVFIQIDFTISTTSNLNAQIPEGLMVKRDLMIGGEISGFAQVGNAFVWHMVRKRSCQWWHPRCSKAPLFLVQIKPSGQPDLPQDKTSYLAWRRGQYGLIAAPCEPPIEVQQSQSCVSCAKAKFAVGSVSRFRNGPIAHPRLISCSKSPEHHFHIIFAQVVQESILPGSRLWHHRHLRRSISVDQKIRLCITLEDSRRSRTS